MSSAKKIIVISIYATIVLIVLIVVSSISSGALLGTIFSHKPNFSITINSTLSSGQGFRNGFIYLHISKQRYLNIQKNVKVYLDGVKIFALKVFPSNLYIPTNGFSDGNHSISITAVSTDNRKGFASIQVLVHDPKLTLINLDFPQELYPGLAVTISVEVIGAATHFVADYSSLFKENVVFNSTIRNGNILSGTVNIPGNISSDYSFHSIPLFVIGTDERSLYVPGIQVFFQSAQSNPFSIEAGIVELRKFPIDNSTDDSLGFFLPENFDISITTGQTVLVILDVGVKSNASAILVGFSGFSHYFTIPTISLANEITNLQSSVRGRRSTNQMLTFEVTLPSDSVSGNPISTDMLVRLSDLEGNLGPIRIIPTILSVSHSGTLHVQLSWDKEVDLDLHVVDPNGEEIYYGHRTSSGQIGLLDLDSNPSCSIDHIKNENIYYQNAISGKYSVRLDLFKDCNITSVINFQILVEGCAINEILTGTVSPSEADSGGLGSGRQVIVFNATCYKYLVRGTIACLNWIPTQFNPIESIVRLVDEQGNVFGESMVQRNSNNPSSSTTGVFSISYQPRDENELVYLEFLSTNKKIDVTDHSGKLHSYRDTNYINPKIEPTASRNIIIHQVNSSGAFYIMTALTHMIALYYAYGGHRSELPLRATWERGKFANDVDEQSSFYNSRDNIIYISGHADDPDEFDDSVLLHEFGHLILARTGAAITGYGVHSRDPVPPNYAFSEGYATYLGQRMIGNLKYCDCQVYPCACLDLSRSSNLILGTILDDNSSSGDISALLVASAAYKLEFTATLHLGMLMRSALIDQDKLLKLSNYNRLGDTSAVDFADMVSLIVCHLGASKKAVSANLLKNEYSLPWIMEPEFCV